MSLPVTVVYATGIWVLAGLIQEGWWIQFGCFALSVFLMVELNNSNALIRIHSRMVACTFLMLSCTACFLFSSLREAIGELCIIASYLILFHTYQDRYSPGMTFYGFLCWGIASLTYAPLLFLLPALWGLMLTNLQTLSWRTFLASLIGVTVPYWFLLCWFFYQDDFTPLTTSLASLTDLRMPFAFSELDSHQIITAAFIILLAVLGILHFWQTSYQDKMRIRMLFGFFIRMDLLIILIFCIQPQHYDILIRLIIINTAPLIAHFIALTRQRVTNILFCGIVILSIALTAYHLWM